MAAQLGQLKVAMGMRRLGPLARRAEALICVGDLTKGADIQGELLWLCDTCPLAEEYLEKMNSCG